MSSRSAEPDTPDCVGVIGAGMMGVSIAHLNSRVGINTILKVRSESGSAVRGQASLDASFAHEVRQGRTPELEAEANKTRIRLTHDYADLSECDMTIECVPEQMQLKHSVLRDSEAAVSDTCLLASCTSSFSIGDLATDLSRPENVLAMHYFWPAHRQPLVEIAVHAGTSEEIIKRAYALAQRQGVQVLRTGATPGYLSTRLILAYFSEAIALLGQGETIEEIDNALESFGWRMGPFRLMDWIGLQDLAHMHDALRPLMGSRVAALEKLWSLANAGLEGRKAGAGFYIYSQGEKRPNQKAMGLIGIEGDARIPPDENWQRPVFMLMNEAAHCLSEGVVTSWEDVDLGANVGLGFPSDQGGLLKYLSQVGVAEFAQALEKWEKHHGERFRPSWQGTIPVPVR